nr:MAG TPA: hypothetical protein [Bacteriophage sp.]
MRHFYNFLIYICLCITSTIVFNINSIFKYS